MQSNDELKDTIVALGKDIFLERGYFDVELSDFAAAAEVTPDTIKELIGQKEELIALIVRNITLDVKNTVCAVERNENSVSEYFTQVGEIYLAKVCDRRAVRVFQYTAGLAAKYPHISTQFKASIGKVNAEFAKSLERERAITLPEGFTYIDAAEQFFALCRGAFHLQLIFDIEYVVSSDEIRAQVKKAVATFLRAFPTQ